MASTDEVPRVIEFARKRRSRSRTRTHERLCPVVGNTLHQFWVARKRAIPCYASNPWSFYEPFVRFDSGLDLVLCKDKMEIRVITRYTLASNSGGFSLPQIQHQ